MSTIDKASRVAKGGWRMPSIRDPQAQPIWRMPPIRDPRPAPETRSGGETFPAPTLAQDQKPPRAARELADRFHAAYQAGDFPAGMNREIAAAMRSWAERNPRNVATMWERTEIAAGRTPTPNNDADRARFERDTGITLPRRTAQAAWQQRPVGRPKGG